MPWEFRDVSIGLKRIREFLIGRKYVLHKRLPPMLSPRSIPAPDIPRGPEYKYSAQYYLDRDILDSVKPPVVAPIAEGCKAGDNPLSAHASKTGHIQFPSELPTPGCVWWWDAHCYYKEVPSAMPRARSPPDTPVLTPPKSVCKQTVVSKASKKDPCAEDEQSRKPAICAPAEPPCQPQPCFEAKPEPPKLPEPCDPCKPKKS